MRRTFALALLALLATSAPAQAQPAPRLAPLESLKDAPVTVSGLSSGGFFAHQMHVAYSGRISGAGIVAAGPYACAEQSPWWLSAYPWRRLVMAVAVCSHKARGSFGWWEAWLPEAPSGAQAADQVAAAYGRGAIDDPKNLARARIWLFAGGRDDVVPPADTRAIQAVYERFGVAATNLVVRFDPRAAHGLPIEEYLGDSRFPRRECGAAGAPYLIDCDFDAAASLLAHLHPGPWTERPAPVDPARLVRFDQAEFSGHGAISLNRAGFLYVPAACAAGAPEPARCRLHIAFHGCLQHEAALGDTFVRHAGYNGTAEANAIVVLYPQTAPEPQVNPEGCWDWWGYTGSDYAERTGRQMRAVRAMIGRLVGE